MSDYKNSNFLGLTPILLFVFLVVFAGIFAENFEAMPILVAFMITAGYALLLNPKGIVIPFGKKVDIFCTGGGEKTIILLVVIFLLAGAFYSLTIDIGARDATVNWALRFVPTAFLLPGLFIISCFISFSMGTSMGTITAIVPIGIGLANKIGIPTPLAVGIVIGGAMFGDNLSFISDTTIAATRTQGVRLKDKFKANLIIALPAALITVVVLMFVEFDIQANIEFGSYNFWLILPYFLIIISALLGLNVITVLGIGIGSACVIGLSFGSFNILGMLKSIQTGMGWMEDLAIIALIIGGIVALMKSYGGVDWLMVNITKNIKSRRGAEFSIAALVSFLDIAIANNTIAIVSAGPIAKDLNQQFKIDPRRTASLLDIFSCGFQGIVPYGGQILTAAALAGLSPLEISPYCWYPMLIIVFGVLAILMGLPKFQDTALDEYGNAILLVPKSEV
ncbi:MAG: Na+/H+ antiporter NhaC family protein [Kordiimonadaceae bacterium]|nr:Na+/H+ antiporter NhaC family protein [Kordiimonadaceae bacterium]